MAYGGRGSSKSISFGLMLVKLASKNNILVLCLREIQNSINDSVYRLLEEIIVGLNNPDWKILKTEIINTRTGSRFIFKGLYRNIASIKSIQGVNIAWVEEAQTVSQESLDLLTPSIRGGEGAEIWFTFNPDQEDDPVYKMFIATEREDSIVKRINYTDNPYFPEVLRKEMEYDRTHNPEKWEWVWNGNCRNETEAQIFKGCYKIEAFDILDNAQFNHGMDFGFAEDPSTVVQSYIHDDILYICKEAYGLHVSIDELPNMIESITPSDEKWWVTADGARPDTIDYIKNHGYRYIKSTGGKDKIIDGIELIKSFKYVIIHPRCKHTIDEFRLYSYKVNKHTGEIMPVPEDKHNHCIDALRYSLKTKKKKTISINHRL